MGEPRKCEYNKDGKCLRWGSGLISKECESLSASFVSNEHFCTDYFQVHEAEDICRVGSTRGNEFVYITDQDIEALKAGKVLFGEDEYGLFLKYKGEKDEG